MQDPSPGAYLHGPELCSNPLSAKPNMSPMSINQRIAGDVMPRLSIIYHFNKLALFVLIALSEIAMCLFPTVMMDICTASVGVHYT